MHDTPQGSLGFRLLFFFATCCYVMFFYVLMLKSSQELSLDAIDAF